MKTSDFTFDLPAELIAQAPLPERSASRLLHVDGESGALSHLGFRDLPTLLSDRDLLVFNNTRVYRRGYLRKSKRVGELRF